VTGYGLDGLGWIPGRSKRFFSSPQRPDRFWCPPSLLFSGYRGALFTGREADHAFPSSAEVKNDGAIPPLPDMTSWRDSFVFTRNQRASAVNFAFNDGPFLKLDFKTFIF
jgi:hypothetical protein